MMHCAYVRPLQCQMIPPHDQYQYQYQITSSFLLEVETQYRTGHKLFHGVPLPDLQKRDGSRDCNRKIRQSHTFPFLYFLFPRS